jgi:DNA-binding GntR family transcriptional regulator
VGATEAPSDDTIQRVSLVDYAAERLRRDLLTGEIEPGERIRVTALEKRFGVSHIPIREALRRLEAEGFVRTMPQRGTVAAAVDLEDLAGLYDLRRLLEGQVIHRAVQQATDAHFAALRAALAALEEAATTIEAPLFWQRHRDFHWALLEPGASAWIKRVLGQVWLAAERYVRLFVTETLDTAMREHRALVAAAEARDADLAQRLLIEHLDRTERTVRRGFGEHAAASDDPDS